LFKNWLLGKRSVTEISAQYNVTRQTIHEWFEQIPFAIVCDGQRGMIKALKERFPGLIIQRCQFHVMKYCLAKLIKKPESVAAQELRFLVLQISQIKTKEQFKLWFQEYAYWRKTHQDFLKEKTYQTENLTPTGKQKWHYTHGRLHAAHSHLKNALPNTKLYLTRLSFLFLQPLSPTKTRS